MVEDPKTAEMRVWGCLVLPRADSYHMVMYPCPLGDSYHMVMCPCLLREPYCVVATVLYEL